MTLPELLTQLAKSAEFDERDAHSQAMKCGYNSNYPTQHKAFEYGSKSENARLQPLIAKLIEAVRVQDEALDKIWDYPASRPRASHEMALIAEEARLKSGLWCDLCGKPILSGHWWHISVNGKPGHCHEECKQEYQRAQIDFKGGAEYKPIGGE